MFVSTMAIVFFVWFGVFSNEKKKVKKEIQLMPLLQPSQRDINFFVGSMIIGGALSCLTHHD